MIPTFHRPAFLYLCLEAIRRAEPKIDIWVFPDHRTEDEVADACKPFSVTIGKTERHSSHGNSRNVMEAIRQARNGSCGVLYHIEDDAIVHPDFFEWARQALLRKPEAFAACGWECPPLKAQASGPDVMMPWYLSVASAIPRASLEEIAKHAVPEYYADLKGYADRTFPGPYVGSNHWEQDGLILRLAMAKGARFLWPRIRRVEHIGWHGYHMKGAAPEGTLAEQIAVTRLVMNNPVLLKRVMNGEPPPSGRHRFCRECGEAFLTNEKAGDYPPPLIACSPCFHKSHPELPITGAAFYYFKP